MSHKLIQITSGKGPAECCWVVAQVQKILFKEARKVGIEPSIIYREPGPENNSLHSVVVNLSGEHLHQFLNSWVGTIQWIGKSKFRKLHKRKNWFIGVNEIMPEKQNTKFYQRDVRFEFSKSGGPGGQHVNKVNTAVRARHLPTGETVFVASGRSQHQNKQEALQRLQSLLENKALAACAAQIKAGWVNHNNLQRGNPIRIFKGSDFKPNHQPQKYKLSRKSDKQKIKYDLND